MSNPSPLRSGFSAAFRRPSLALAEITWRWTWGLASLLMVIAAARAYLRSLYVSGGERFELRSGDPGLIADAISRILTGTGPLLIKLLLVILPPIFILWIVAASLGRAATLNDLLGGGKGRAAMRPLLGVHFLRAALALALVLGYVGAALVASLVVRPAGDADPQALVDGIWLYLLIFLAILVVVVSAWSMLNWFLSLAPVFVVRDGHDGLAAFSASVKLSRRRRSEFTTVGLVLGAIRFVWVVAITVVSLISAMLIPAAPWLGWTLIILFALLYFAVADWLYIARLGAYVAIAQADAGPAITSPPPVPLTPVEVTMSMPTGPAAGA